ncbi:type I polyketide synthase [Streptomyces sp. NPDC003023]|uniref:type I polyketide synthase n=1 Tax=Streptomyces sp. NPDC003023 TaxID=3364675 RepID=UPI0036B490E8
MSAQFENEPIAIIGVGLRFPGENSTREQFAEFLRCGKSGVTRVPEGRLPSVIPEDANTDAGYLQSLRDFDATFFGISPREAAFIDPQHRLSLETSWEALEDAGIDPTSLRHSNTGVYVAVTGMDYAMEIARLPLDQVELYAGTGMFHAGASGRVSYFLGLRGPALSVDGACASSLVAVHLAVQGLRLGECNLALCGAANTISDPAYPVMASRSGVLAPDSRCKTFDEAGDGYVRGEGAAMIALKRLKDAQRDGDRVLAVIRGSAVRQDGESAALMAPNAKAQAALMRATLDNAGLTPHDIQYIEAHGTGTAIGDPIEMRGISEVFSASHSQTRPVAVGSVKTNLGHLESTAGLAGLIKTLLQLRDRTIYPHLNFSIPSSRIPWSTSPVSVPTAVTPWTATGARTAMVNSYGATGTIASVVLQEAPEPQQPCPPTDNGESGGVLTISAKSEASLHRQIQAYTDLAAGIGREDIAALCRGTNVTRAHHLWRVSTTVGSTEDLNAFLERQLRHGRRTAPVAGRKRAAFLFPGGGTQYPDMGGHLYRRFPRFRQHYDQCSALFEPALGWSLSQEIAQSTAPQPGTDNATVLTARLFTLEYALAQFWMSLGVQPSVLLGHSLGEITAAAVAGVMELPDAVRLVLRRGQLLDSTPVGAMVAIEASPDQVMPLLDSAPDLSLGAVNGPQQCVISGARDAATELASALAQQGFKVKILQVPVASHSPLMDQILDEYQACLETITLHPPKIAIASTVLGRIAEPEEITAPDHWLRHLRDTVRLVDAMRAIETRGSHSFLEIGPGSELLGMGRDCTATPSAGWFGSMHRKDTAANTISQSVSRLYAAGFAIDWAAWHEGQPAQPLRHGKLPLYQFDRKPHWLPTPKNQPVSAGQHALLGTETTTPQAEGGFAFRSVVSAHQPAYLSEHTVHGAPAFPGTGFIEMLLAAQDTALGEATKPIEDLTFHEPLFLTSSEVSLHTEAASEPDGYLHWRISSSGADGLRTLHLTARTPRNTGQSLADAVLPTATRGAPDAEMATQDLAAYFEARGACHGPTFSTAARASRYGKTLVIGDIETTPHSVADVLHPALLAGALQTSACLFAEGPDDGSAYTAVRVQLARLVRKPRGRSLRSELTVTHETEQRVTVDLTLYDQYGEAFRMRGVELQRFSAARPQLPHNELHPAAALPSIDIGAWHAMTPQAKRERARTFVLAHIADLLQFPTIEDVPQGASFFDMGMDSLLAVRLKNVAEKSFGITLDLRTILGNPTIEALADLLATGQEEPANPQETPA